GSEFNIKVFRVINLIEWIKDNSQCGIDRKTAKTLWAASDRSRLSEKSKEIFNRIWPLPDV
ncbi:MAG TPA: hypothetical protein VHR47_12640, partial [Bacillota bacterium]|nr:hypothetical protein [Bacillota bacterium]